MAEDWFAENAPKASQQPKAAAGGEDWFAENAPKASPAPATDQPYSLKEFVTSPNGFIRTGLRQAKRGVQEFIANPSVKSGLSGASDVMEGIGTAAIPAAIPAAIAAPAPAALAAGLGYVGGKISEAASRAFGAGPEAQRFFRNVGGAFAGGGGFKAGRSPVVTQAAKVAGKVATDTNVLKAGVKTGVSAVATYHDPLVAPWAMENAGKLAEAVRSAYRQATLALDKEMAASLPDKPKSTYKPVWRDFPDSPRSLPDFSPIPATQFPSGRRPGPAPAPARSTYKPVWRDFPDSPRPSPPDFSSIKPAPKQAKPAPSPATELHPSEADLPGIKQHARGEEYRYYKEHAQVKKAINAAAELHRQNITAKDLQALSPADRSKALGESSEETFNRILFELRGLETGKVKPNDR